MVRCGHHNLATILSVRIPQFLLNKRKADTLQSTVFSPARTALISDCIFHQPFGRLRKFFSLGSYHTERIFFAGDYVSASPLQLKAWRPCGPGKAGADAPVDRFAFAFSLMDAVSLPSFCFLLGCSCFLISLSLKVERLKA